MGTDPHTHSSMHALVVLALGLACANALVPYAYNGYAGHAFPGYAYPGYAGHAYAGYGYPAYAHAAVAAPVEVEEKAVEVAPLSYTHHAAPYAYAAPAYAPYAAPAYAHPAAPAYAPTYASQYHSQEVRPGFIWIRSARTSQVCSEIISVMLLDHTTTSTQRERE